VQRRKQKRNACYSTPSEPHNRVQYDVHAGGAHLRTGVQTGMIQLAALGPMACHSLALSWHWAWIN